MKFGGSPESVVQLANKSASVRGEAVAAVVLLDGGAVAVQVIIIKMNNTNGETATTTAKKNSQRSTDAANFTKEELVTRSQVEELQKKPLHPGTDQDTCLASSLSYTINKLN